MASPRLKSSFAVQNKYGAFYTGGKVQFDTGGEYAFCQCGNQVQVLDISTGTLAHTIGQDEDDEVTSFVLSPDKQILVLAHRNLLLKQWDWRNGEVTRTWKAIHTSPVSCMVFDGTSTLLATGGSDSTVKVWDVIKQYCTHNLRGHKGVISVTKFHPDTERLHLYSAGDDYQIRVWALSSSQQVVSLEGHYSAVTALDFNTDGTRLYSAARDNVVIIWNVDTHTKVSVLPVYEALEALVLLPPGEEFKYLGDSTSDPHFITAGSKGLLRVWNAKSRVCVYTKSLSEVHTSSSDDKDILQVAAPSSVDSSSSGSDSQAGTAITCACLVGAGSGTLAVVTAHHNIILYNLHNLKPCKRFIGYYDDILDVKMMGSSDSHVAVSSNSADINVFEHSTWNCHVLQGHTDFVLSLDVSTDGHTLVSASKDASVRVWQMSADGLAFQCVAVARGHTQALNAVAISRLSVGFVVSGGGDCTIKLWKLEETTVSKDNAPHTLYCLATEHAHDKEINGLAVAPNDKFIASASQDKTAKLWNSSTLALMGVFRGHRRGVWSCQFSPVDQCLATSSADGTIKIWALSDFSCVKTFEGHDSSVLRVQFLTTGMQLISSGSDGLLKLWTIKTNECVKTLDGHDDKVWALAVSKQEDVFISAAANSTITIWKDVTVEEMDEARNKQEEFIIKEQELSNLVHEKKWLKALTVAITLDQPYRALGILKEMLSESDGEENIKRAISKLRDDQLASILRYSGEWNTNSKHCHVAQLILSIALTNHSPAHLSTLPNFKETLEALLPYTERHFERMNRLLQQAQLVDYTWHCMRTVSGDTS